MSNINNTATPLGDYLLQLQEASLARNGGRERNAHKLAKMPPAASTIARAVLCQVLVGACAAEFAAGIVRPALPPMGTFELF